MTPGKKHRKRLDMGEAIRERLRVGKGFCGYRTAGRSCHVFGLLLRLFSWPLAIVLSADRVPVKSTRS